MLAAGWGGAGTVINEAVDYCAEEIEMPSFCRRQSSDTPLFSRRQSPERLHEIQQQTTPSKFISNCNERHPKRFRQNLIVTHFADLIDCKMPDRVLGKIDEIGDGFDLNLAEEIIVLAFLLALSRSSIGRYFSSKTLKAINRTVKTKPVDKHLIDQFSDVLTDISEDDWGPGFPAADSK